MCWLLGREEGGLISSRTQPDPNGGSELPGGGAPALQVVRRRKSEGSCACSVAPPYWADEAQLGGRSLG